MLCKIYKLLTLNITKNKYEKIITNVSSTTLYEWIVC